MACPRAVAGFLEDTVRSMVVVDRFDKAALLFEGGSDVEVDVGLPIMVSELAV
jgi:hypothetical protein